MALKPMNKPAKGILDWDAPINENFQNIADYAKEVDEKLDKTAPNNHTHSADDVGAAAKTHSHDSLPGNAETATKLATERTIDGVKFNGSVNISHYAECTTAAATAAKTVSITGFTLATGARATIKFTITNTATAPTLNITSTGAKDMYYRGTKITNAAPTLQANGIYDFIYNGTAYEIVGNFGGGYGC